MSDFTPIDPSDIPKRNTHACRYGRWPLLVARFAESGHAAVEVHYCKPGETPNGKAAQLAKQNIASAIRRGGHPVIAQVRGERLFLIRKPEVTP